MIKRMYVNNFRCLVNFELKFDRLNLLLGNNGSGKTTLFHLLFKLKQFILGDEATPGKYYQISELFNRQDLTRWQNSDQQTFELELESSRGIYQYFLTIQYSDGSDFPKMTSEKLILVSPENQQVLFEFFIDQEDKNQLIGKAKIANDDPQHPGITLPLFDDLRSGVGFVYDRSDNQKLTEFKKRLANLFIVRINPFQMNAISRQVNNQPNWDVSNYAAWYTYLSQEYQDKIINLTLELQKIIKGFNSFKISQNGNTRKLEVIFNLPYKIAYSLDELSEGQKVLIVLYSLIYCHPDGDFTLCIDEPDNFLALPEIQPWFQKLFDHCQEQKTQALMISHHPSLINYLASSFGYWFERQDNIGVRVQQIKEEQGVGLSIAKLIELGWLYKVELTN